MAKEKQITLEELLASSDPKKMISTLAFEDTLKLLEELVVAVERGSLPLERAILSYEKGAVLVEHLRAALSGAEERLKVLKKNKSGSIDVEEA